MFGSNEKHRVTLDEGFEGEVIRGGIRIAFNANGGVDVYAPVPVTFHAAANENAQPQPEPKIGDPMPAGTEYAGMKYAGLSPDTGKPFYVDASDAPGTYSFDAAEKYAASQGKRLPSKEELNVLFNNRAAIGGFNVTGSDSAGWYWSSSRYGSLAWAQRFGGGHQYYDGRGYASSLHMNLHIAIRCVR